MVPRTDLRERLSTRLVTPASPDTAPGDRAAAVLLLLIAGSDPAVLLTVRAAGLSRHAGEISFPGGLADPGETPEATALREAFEEIGLAGRLVEIVGALPEVNTVVSRIVVVPVVGLLAEPPVLRANGAEIDEVLTIPLSRLRAGESVEHHERPDGGRWRGFAYDVGGRTVWGATGLMVHGLLELIPEEEAAWTT